MHFKSKKKRRITQRMQLNLASMIDVVFLLNIYFLVTTAFTLPESQLDQAIATHDAKSAGQQSDFTPQVLNVEIAQGRAVYRIGSHVMTNRNDLIALLRDLPKSLGIYVKVDNSVSVGFAASALQSCQDAGFKQVTYVPGTN